MRAVRVIGLALCLAGCAYRTQSPHVGGSYLAEAPRAAASSTASTAAGIDPTASPYSCPTNNTSSASTCLQSAITAAAAAGQKVILGGHTFSVTATLQVTAPIEGPGAISQQTAGIDTLLVPNTAQGVRLANFACYAPAGSTAGACIHDEGYRTVIEDVVTVNGCIGIDDDDPYGAYYANDYVWYGSIASGCRGLRIGHGAYSQGSYILNLNVGAPAGVTNTYGAELVNVGGATFSGGGSLGLGTLVDPGSGQVIAWTVFSGYVFGDTLPSSGLTVQPATGGLVQGLFSVGGSWVGTAGYCAGTAGCPASGYNAAPSIDLDAAAGTIKGAHFTAQRIVTGLGGQGIYAAGPNLTDLTIDGSSICGTATAAIELGAGVGASIRNNDLRSDCDSAVATPTVPALKLDGGNTVLFTGNDMTGSAGISGTAASGSAIGSNLGP